MSCQLPAGDVEACLAILKDLPDSNATNVYNAAMRCAGRQPPPCTEPGTTVTRGWLPKQVARPASCGGAGLTRNVSCRSLPARATLRVFQAMEQAGVEPNTYTVPALVNAYAALGMLRHLDGAMQGLLRQHQQLVHWSAFFCW